MSEHQIDEYFREHLKGVEEPILPNDFSEFEKLAIKPRSWKWLYMLLLLPLIGVSAYFYSNSQANTILTNTAAEANEERKNSDPTSIDNTASSELQSTENGNTQTLSAHTAGTGNTASTPIIFNNGSEANGIKTAENSELENKKIVKENALSSVTNGMNPVDNSGFENQTSTKENTVSSETNGINTADNSEFENRTSTKENAVSNDSPNSESTNSSGLTEASKNIATASVVTANNKESNSKSSNGAVQNVINTSSAASIPNQGENGEKTKSYSRSSDSSTEMDANFQKLQSVGPSEIDINNSPELNSNIVEMAQPELKAWRIDAFIQYEFNNELGGIPSAGFVSSYQKNKWNIGVGLGIGQTGTLNWTQTRKEISYGFDAYQEDYQLETKNFTFISMPIHLAYQVFARSEVFIGLSPEMVINASQAYRVSETNQDQSTGYLYKTGAPSLLLFMNLGYGFSLTEDFKLDLGINYSPQKWNVTEKNPLGGFIRLKYNIK